MGISLGSIYEYNAGNSPRSVVINLTATTFVVVYYSGWAVIGTISSTNVISYGTPVRFYSASAVNENAVAVLDSTHFVIAYNDASLNAYTIIGTVSSGNVITFGSQANLGYGTYPKYLAVCKLDSTHFAVSWQRQDSAGSLSAVGTVSSGDVITMGSSQTWSSSSNSSISCAELDSTHFALIYGDGADSSHTKVVIATRSSDTITYGTAQEVYAGSGSTTICKLSSTLFVVAYTASSQYGKVRAFTVSGTSITLGSEVALINSAVYVLSVCSLDATTFCLSYNNGGDSNHLYGKCGTVSGSTITLQDIVEIANTAVTTTTRVTAVSSTTLVFSYTDAGDSSHGKAIVGIYSLPSGVKSINGLSKASIKSVNSLVTTSVKSFNGLT